MFIFMMSYVYMLAYVLLYSKIFVYDGVCPRLVTGYGEFLWRAGIGGG